MRMSKTTCKARTRQGSPCRCKPVPGSKRCRLHGGLSTGPRTPEGKASSVNNLQKAMAAWLAPENAEARHLRAVKAAKTRQRNQRLAKWGLLR